MTPRRRGAWPWLSYIAIAALPLAVLWPALDAGPVSDDIFFAGLYRLGSWRDLALGAWPHSMGPSDGWRPIALLSYGVTSAWTDGTPAIFRLCNVLLHGLNALLLARVVGGLTGQRAAAVAAGALFAVHPVVHENVVWISGRTYPLAAAFGLALLAWSLDAERRGPWLQHGVGSVLLICALASYEFAVMLPGLLAMVLLMQGRRVDAVAARSVAMSLAPYVGVLLAYFAFRWLWLTDLRTDLVVTARGSQWAPGVGPIHERFVRNSAFLALKLLAGPWFDRGSDLRIDLTMLLTLGVAGAAAVTLWVRGARMLLAGWMAWIALAFLPVATYVGFADRFAYLSTAGFCGLMGSAFNAWHAAASTSRRTAAVVLVIVMGVGWMVALQARATDWITAGREVARVVRAGLAVEPGPARPTDLQFVGIPRRHGAALTLITYFPQALWQHYAAAAQSHVDIQVTWDAPDEVRARQDALPCPRDRRVYVWDEAAGAMRPLWSCVAS